MRLDRAKEYREAIQRDFRRLEEDGSLLRVEPNDEKTVLDVFLNLPEVQWSLLVSDCLHQMRAALDNMVYALYVARCGVPNPAKAYEIAFPICTSREQFDNRGGARIEGLDPGAVAIITRAQPYKRRDRPEFHPLAVLGELNNRDKHRALHLTLMEFASFRAENPAAHPIDFTTIRTDPRPENGAHLMRIQWARPTPPGMEVGFGFTARVGIHYVWRLGRGRDAVEDSVLMPLDSALHGIHKRASRVVAVLAPFLE